MLKCLGGLEPGVLAIGSTVSRRCLVCGCVEDGQRNNYSLLILLM